MQYNINIREESFGATVFNLLSGKREYITREELKRISEENIFPNDSITRDIKDKFKIKFTPLDEKDKNINHFSFADIAYIEVTRACNLACKHCLNNSGKIMENQLNLGELQLLVEKLAEAGIQEIRFTGGEPLVFDGIYELIKLANEKGVYTSIGTNGTLINENIAKKLKKVGLKKAIVSLDGTEEMHDYIRGTGNYQKTINGIKNLEANGIEVRVNAVVMRTNLDNIISFAKEMHQKQIPLFIRRFIESGRGTNLKDNTLKKSEYDYLREQLSKELKEGKYVNGHYLRNDEGIVHRITLPFNFIKGCKAGQRAIVIMPDGELHLCGFLAAQNFPSIGNVRNVSNWRKYWNDIHNFDYLKELRENLDRYNSLPNMQETNCLAYVQRFLSLEREANKEKIIK